jgi:hypothetical protein
VSENRDHHDADEVFRREIARLAAPPYPEPRTARGRRFGSVAAAAFATLALAGVGGLMAVIIINGHHEYASPSPGIGSAKVVPWAALPATSTPTPTPGSGVPCDAGALTATPFTFAGFAAGTVGFSATVSLSGTSSCYVPESPSIAFVSATGSSFTLSPNETPASTTVGLSPTQGQVSAFLEIHGWCADTLPAHATVTLADGSTLAMAVATPPAVAQSCSEPGSSTYSFDLQAPPQSPSPTPAVTAPVSVAVNALNTATPGEHFGYEVTLTNSSNASYALTPCPTYDEGLKTPNGFSVTYELNCAAASAVPAGGSETFEMYLDIPASIPAGTFELTWGIEGTPWIIAASAPLTVVS